MGFLRKVGRKIKKKVNKLFGSKFGKIIGGIGLSLILGPLVSRAFNGISGFFTKGATDAATKVATDVVTDATTDVVTDATTDVVTDVVTDATTKAATDATNVAVVDSTVSGAVEKLVNTPDLVIDFGENIFEGGVGLKGDASLKGDISARVAEAAAKGPTLNQEVRQNIVNLGEGIKEFTQNPMQKTKEFVGDDFIPDIAKSTGSALAISAIQGKPEEPFISGGVAPQPQTEASQNAYLAEVQNQIPDYQGFTFQNLNNSMLVGTLSPQFLIGQAQSYS
jgi:hypothetical protein